MSTKQIPQLIDDVCVTPEPAPMADAHEAAYQRLRAEIASVDDADLANLNVDIPSAVTTVQAAIPALLPLREQLAGALCHFDVAQFDKLLDYAHALAHLQSEYTRAKEPAPEMPALYTSAVQFRDAAVAAGRLLGKLGLIDAKVFEAAGSVNGYRNVGYELKSLCSELQSLPPSMAARLPLTPEQVARGKALATRLIDGAATRDKASLAVGAAGKERLRAYTLLAKAYTEARRAVVYLRWHEADADTIAPTFYLGRGGNGGRKSEADAPGEPAAPSLTLSGADAGSSPRTARSVSTMSVPESHGDPLFTDPPAEPFLHGHGSAT